MNMAAIPTNAKDQAWRLPRRLAYVISHGLPWSTNGYAVRSHAIARALVLAGQDVLVLTRPGRPWNIETFSTDARVPLDQMIDGVRYVCLPRAPLPGASPETILKADAAALKDAFEVFRPASVLAASNWETAEPARRAAEATGAAFFYEQRGFWEMALPDEKDRQTAREMETKIALGARAVFTLNASMREELIGRGIPQGRIHVVPNGLSAARPPDHRITRERIGIGERYLIGYIGSLSPYEGVDDLIRVLARLRKGKAGIPPIDVGALIVGSNRPKGLVAGPAASGPEDRESALKSLARSLSMAPHVHFIPQQPLEVIDSYFALCDAIVLPRRATPVTLKVPPLKPYAAAAHGLPVVMTDLPPLAEIAAEMDGHLFPEGDIAAFAQKLLGILIGRHSQSGPARINYPGLSWSARIRPMRDALNKVTESVRQRNRHIFKTEIGQASRDEKGPVAARPPEPSGFDLRALPGFALHRMLAPARMVLIGPPPPTMLDHPSLITPLSRNTLLDVLATAEPSRFVINWAGLRATDGASEWAGLWSVEDMRLNRQIIDAVRIALSRGWRVQVLGPVYRSQAPLFRTVASVIEEIRPEVDA